jgi:hypothetical protein
MFTARRVTLVLVACAALIAAAVSPAEAGRIQPVLSVPALSSITVRVEPGVVWYGWHGTRHGSEGRYVTVPACPVPGEEALIVSNDDPFARPVKFFVEPNSFNAAVKGTDTSITVVPTCTANAVPIP